MRLSPLSRIAAVVSSLLLLQLSLLASGTLCCRTHTQHGHAMSASAHADDMQMTADGTHDISSPAVVDVSATSPTGSCDTNGSCGGPWAPSTGCGANGTCVSTVAAAMRALVTGTAILPARVSLLASAAMPIGPVFAPEPPPPRA